jgi:hypothetical protein
MRTHDEKSTFSISGASLQFVITLSGVAVTLLNIFLLSKLAPLTQDIALINQRVSANESQDERTEDRFDKRFTIIETKLDTILEKLARR